MEARQAGAQPRLSFGALLRHHRQAAGLTQEALAERAGVGVRTVRELEREGVQRPRSDTVDLLATALVLLPADHVAFAAAASARRHLTAARAGSRALDSPPLVGRQRELALLERHLAGEGPPILLLAGEPGMGKTRLLQEAALRAEAQGWHVLAGGCQRHGGQTPYAPVLDALDRYVHEQRAAELRHALEGCAWLVRLLPELATGPIEPLPGWTLSPEQERRLMFGAVARLLANVAGPAGTLLLLDDLQWASPDALDLLSTLAHAPAAVSLRIVGAYRDTEVRPQDPLSVLLADFAHARLEAHCVLHPLAHEEARQLLDVLLPGAEGALRDRVLQRTGGVPFYLMSCAQALYLAERDGGPPAVPWDVAQSLRQRVASLPGVAQEILGAAAVAVGRMVQPPLLTAVVNYPEGEVLAGLEAAWQARLLTEVDGAYRFAHDLVREAVEADLSAARRAALHGRLAGVLEREPGEPPVELLAYHYARSNAQEKAVLYLERAGDHAHARHAHAVATDYYQEVVHRLDKLGRTLDGTGVREKLGDVLTTMARYAAALQVLEPAVAILLAADDLERAGRVAGRLARIHYLRGTPEVGIAYLQPLLERLEAGDPSGALAALYTVQADLLVFSGRGAEELAAADRAAQIARVVGDARILAWAEHARGTALILAGRDEAAVPAITVATQLAEAQGDDECLAEALDSLAWISEERGEFEQSRYYAERAILAAERQGNPARIADETGRLGDCAFYLGKWKQARRCYEQAEVIDREIGIAPTSCSLAGLLLQLGRLSMAQGEWETASHYLEQSSSIYAPQGKRAGLREVQSLLAERDLLEGHAAVARERLLPLLDRWGVEEHYVTTHVLPWLAWAYLDLGDTDYAGRVVADAIRRARAQHYRLALVAALRVQAMVASRQGRWDEAVATLEEGLALTRILPYPYAEGRLLHLYGATQVQKGEPARAWLESALAIFQRLGARKDLEGTAQLLSTLG